LQKEISTGTYNRYLIDGFPRNADNLQGWEKYDMSDICDVECVVFLECGEAEMLRRVLRRGETSGRKDDNEVTLRRRFQGHLNNSLPIIEYYEKNASTSSTRLVRIDGEQEPEAVYRTIVKNVLEPIFQQELFEAARSGRRKIRTVEFKYPSLVSCYKEVDC
jgi:adenylate kinase family enzyme